MKAENWFQLRIVGVTIGSQFAKSAFVPGYLST